MVEEKQMITPYVIYCKNEEKNISYKIHHAADCHWSINLAVLLNAKSATGKNV